MREQPKDGDKEDKHHDMCCRGQGGGIIQNAAPGTQLQSTSASMSGCQLLF